MKWNNQHYSWDTISYINHRWWVMVHEWYLWCHSTIICFFYVICLIGLCNVPDCIELLQHSLCQKMYIIHLRLKTAVFDYQNAQWKLWWLKLLRTEWCENSLINYFNVYDQQTYIFIHFKPITFVFPFITLISLSNLSLYILTTVPKFIAHHLFETFII